ncbi:hypothetical protein [Limosilactobacillus oris]|uniref:hypothetical protein n=1 Tax=Limosilactobacillus oris TaxID=1632 RepID=UPI00265AA266|nr:hypothetical protein [Limosilactobacillus oris]
MGFQQPATNIQYKIIAPDEFKKVEYGGTSGTTHAPISTNYGRNSVSVYLDGTTEGETNQYRMVVGFAYGSPSGIYGESASMGHVFMSTQIPTKVTTTIHYVDQKTGDDIATPKNFEGVGYQGYTITGLRQRLMATL